MDPNVFISIIIIAIFIMAIKKIFKYNRKVKYKKSSKLYRKKASTSSCKKSTTSANFKGKVGEMTVSFILGKNIENKKYVINDYKLRDGDKTVQIDHILINENGVFVIETKSYVGDIYGKEDSLNWKQYLAGGNVVNEFYNPLKQNKAHAFSIKNILPKHVMVHSVVVFTNSNVEKLNIENVITKRELKEYVNTFRGCKMAGPLIASTYYTLKRNEDKTITNKEHVNNIKQTLTNIDNNICPRCKGKLVKRVSKYGEFYGCENYPKCTFIKKH